MDKKFRAAAIIGIIASLAGTIGQAFFPDWAASIAIMVLGITVWYIAMHFDRELKKHRKGNQ